MRFHMEHRISHQMQREDRMTGLPNRRAFEEYTRLRMQAMGPILPDGYGLMRVIPVESAIEGLPGVTDDERLSYYLNKYDTFSVSPCSCRASRTLLGDGCGHLAEDMCVQMGKGAEHYIRSGRARQISREEAYEIVKRAEENGLMHDIPNIEGSGETSAICLRRLRTSRRYDVRRARRYPLKLRCRGG